MSYEHSPVLVEEVIENLVTDSTKTFLDCTLGEGGHAEEILTRFPGINYFGLDRDKEILKIAGDRLLIFQERVKLININFRDVSLKVLEGGGDLIDSALIDLGISNYHYKMSKRGFSFSKKEKLSMKLDDESLDICEVINNYSEEDISNIFFEFGEERFSRRIAKKIVEERKTARIKYSDQLADVIAESIPKKFHPKNIHPATRCFQALRIYANSEFDNIKKGIPKVFSVLKNKGRLGVITFHSIEDRMVKNIFNEMYNDCICPDNVPRCVCDKKREINWIKKRVMPTEDEIKNNNASRSAKLRVVEKI